MSIWEHITNFYRFPISFSKIFWRNFIILLVSCGISSKTLNVFSHFFYIDGTKNAKASFWSFKKYKVFYTKFHSAQQNELYVLIQVICLHPYIINIVWLYIVSCIKKYKSLHHKLLVLLKQTMVLPIFLDALNTLQVFLIIHRHKT